MNPRLTAVMISCAKRKAHLVATFNRFKKLGGDVDLQVILDTTACENRGLVVDRPQERQERGSLLALEKGLESGADYILFLEDDLDFNRHILHNLLNWKPLVNGCLDFGSLYNPTVVGSSEDSKEFPNTRIADIEKVYGSQAFLLSRGMARHCVENWWSIEGMQDIKMSRLAADLHVNAYYHFPSLVQHVGRSSAWTQDNRFHQAPDFRKDWKA